eukprot:CAMPEP_0171171752 /NCGR_PEP_ID=MMETSP0790-20130122/9374_1 /TAXON_ID=2925 /ORGANISM="Alexandrium catenella, Strain OF101" /LENGTH=484 /DNA_ID=CAMNT_0011636605 /DNA_START=108 /DNA_END=1560 /DNA_ORIENTATION=-
MPKVQAYVYDITQGMASRMSVPLLGKQIDIIPHTGIVAFGKEYFFGSGPCIAAPGQAVPVATSQILDLGETNKTAEELEAYINGVLALEHTSEKYNLLSHNCNHYADAVAKFLLDGTGLPLWIVNIAEEALSTPRGQSLRVMIETMEKSMRSNMGGGSALNPFGDVAAPGVAVPPSSSFAAAPLASDPELEAALREITAAPMEDRRLALQTLMKITENVERNPAEQKFRRIKMANAVFTKKVAGCSGGVEAMVACGWLPDCTPDGEDAWVLDEDAARRQAMPRQRFAAELAKLPAAPAQPVVPARSEPAPPMAPTPGLGGLGGLGGMGGMGGMEGQMQQMMNNPQMMAQAQQMMQNPEAMAQAQQMMQNPQAMAQMQQMMQNPQMMAQMQNMMGGTAGAASERCGARLRAAGWRGLGGHMSASAWGALAAFSDYTAFPLQIVQCQVLARPLVTSYRCQGCLRPPGGLATRCVARKLPKDGGEKG